MNNFRHGLIAALLCICAPLVWADSVCNRTSAAGCQNSQVISTSGGTVTINNAVAGRAATFSEAVAGSPATVSIVVQGCMYGAVCDSALDTNTTVGSSNRPVNSTTVYDYYLITASWTGGSNVSVTINSTISMAASGTGGGPPNGAAGGTLSGTYPNPGLNTGQSNSWTAAQTFTNGLIGTLASDPGSCVQGEAWANTANSLWRKCTATAVYDTVSGSADFVNYAQYYALATNGCLDNIEPSLVGTTGGAANNICIINHWGDSYTAGDYLSGNVRTWLQNYWHDAGAGWVTFSSSAVGMGAPPDGATVNTTGGSIVYTNQGSGGTTWSYGPDDTDTSLTAASTITATCANTTDMYLWDVNGITAGSFTYNYNAGGANTLTDTVSSAALRVTHLGPTTVGTQSVVITWVSGTVYPLGVYCINNTSGFVNGVIVNRLGASGSTASAWNTFVAGNPIFASEMTNLVVANSSVTANVFLFGANELVANVAPATYVTNFNTFVSSIVSSFPNADVGVATAVDNGTGSLTYTMAQYAAVLQDSARQHGYMYLGNREWMRGYTRDNTLGLMADVTHPSHTNGFALMANNEKMWLTAGHLPQTYKFQSGLNSIYFDPSGQFPGSANITLATGIQNTGFGVLALRLLSTGTTNTSFGYDAGAALTTGSGNTFIGNIAGAADVINGANTGVGDHALQSVTGLGDTGLGQKACGAITNGSENVCIGASAGNADGTTSAMSHNFITGATTYYYTNYYFGAGISNAANQQATTTLNSTGATAGNSNIAGENLYLQAGAGTGNTTPTMVCHSAPVIGSSGTTVQAEVIRQCDNDYKALTSGAAVTLLSIPLAADSTTGGDLTYTIRAIDASHHNCTRSGTITWAGENSNGTFVAAPSAATSTTENVACTSGSTLTASWTLTGANPALLQLTATTSITITSMDVVYNFVNNGQTNPTP